MTSNRIDVVLTALTITWIAITNICINQIMCSKPTLCSTDTLLIAKTNQYQQHFWYRVVAIEFRVLKKLGLNLLNVYFQLIERLALSDFTILILAQRHKKHKFI